MGRLTRKYGRKNTRRATAARRYSSPARTPGGSAARRGRSGKGSSRAALIVKAIAEFLRRNIKFVAAGAFVLAAGIVCLIIFTGGAKEVSSDTSAAQSPEISVVTEYADMESYSYENVDADTLAGLAGTGEGLFSDDAEMEAELLAAEGIRIGVTVLDLPTDIDEAVLGRMEALSSATEQSKRIYKTFYYNARGSATQQMQDIRSLINNEVDVIIVGATNAESFKKVCLMAAEAGIPVVAYDAPVSEGYVVNVVTDQNAWGEVYGSFVAQRLEAGNVLQVLGSADNAVDQLRAQGIAAGLAANPKLALLDTVYASWKGKNANKAVAELLSRRRTRRIDAVITEEGMAASILDAFIEAEMFPKVMCGDVTAGFIKKWYLLKNGGLPIETDDKNKKKNDTEPTPTPTLLLAAEDELTACAQPAPLMAGATAFEIAVRMAEGRILKEQGATITCAVQTMITQDNLAECYDKVKDAEDTALISDILDEEMLEALFEPMTEADATEGTAETAAATPAATPTSTPSATATPAVTPSA